jgi:hypothetical protein
MPRILARRRRDDWKNQAVIIFNRDASQNANCEQAKGKKMNDDPVDNEPAEKLLIDHDLADLFCAFKDCSILYNESENLDVRSKVLGIQRLIFVALSNLVDLGVHSRKRLQEFEREWKIW